MSGRDRFIGNNWKVSTTAILKSALVKQKTPKNDLYDSNIHCYNNWLIMYQSTKKKDREPLPDDSIYGSRIGLLVPLKWCRINRKVDIPKQTWKIISMHVLLKIVDLS